MTQSVAEVLVLTISALGAGILMFVAGVAQKIMNDLDELEFKRFLNQLDRAAMSDPSAVTVATLPSRTIGSDGEGNQIPHLQQSS